MIRIITSPQCFVYVFKCPDVSCQSPSLDTLSAMLHTGRYQEMDCWSPISECREGVGHFVLIIITEADPMTDTSFQLLILMALLKYDR